MTSSVKQPNVVIRSSRFRHVQAEPGNGRFENVRMQLKTSEGNGIAVSDKAIAIPWHSAGGSVAVVSTTDSSTRKLPHDLPLLVGHTASILDLDFDPFRSDRLATASEDTTVRLWENGKSIASLEGVHTRKVMTVKFNPVADGVVASGAFDGSLALWNLASVDVPVILHKHNLGASVNQVTWNFLGSLLLANCADKSVKIIDPRQAGECQEISRSHEGVKGVRATWLCSRPASLSEDQFLLTCGFSSTARREFSIWDRRSLATPAFTQTLDDNSGLIYPLYDEYTGLTFLAGRGDGNIRIYEFADGCMHYLTDFRSQVPQRGLALYPKRAMRPEKNEVARIAKVETSAVQILSFTVPRKAEVFQDDLFPPCADGTAALSAAAWAAGGGAEPPKTPMGKVGQHKRESTAQAPVLAEPLHKRVAELEAENAKLRADLEAEKKTSERLRKQLAKE